MTYRSIRTIRCTCQRYSISYLSIAFSVKRISRVSDIVGNNIAKCDRTTHRCFSVRNESDSDVIFQYIVLRQQLLLDPPHAIWA